jgi:hypothetical protein
MVQTFILVVWINGNNKRYKKSDMNAHIAFWKLAKIFTSYNLRINL